MDETYFNVVYFFKYFWLIFKVIAIQLTFVQKVCFKVYFKHYRTSNISYFTFYMLHIAYTVPT